MSHLHCWKIKRENEAIFGRKYSRKLFNLGIGRLYSLMEIFAPPVSKCTHFLYFISTSISDPDPYHLAGSGSRSASGNVDLDPGTKKKS